MFRSAEGDKRPTGGQDVAVLSCKKRERASEFTHPTRALKRRLIVLTWRRIEGIYYFSRHRQLAFELHPPTCDQTAASASTLEPAHSLTHQSSPHSLTHIVTCTS